MSEKVKLKIASASCNQTGGDWPRNVANICAAIDRAVADGADILALEELGLTGYERGDDFYYSDNNVTRQMLQVIADYAAAQDKNLVISVGHPWYLADKLLPDQEERRKNPLFNRIDNNFNVQTLISGGKILSMSAKRYLFNYERGYEKRHFEEWSDAAANAYKNEFGQGRSGTIMVRLPAATAVDGSILLEQVIPFGSPVVSFGINDKCINLTHVICEEYWVGSRFDNATDDKDYANDSPLARKAREFDITVCLNPNASPPVAGKIDKHYHLAKLASQYCGVLVHTDGLGTSGSTFAQFGSRLMAQKGEIVSEGVRCSFKDMTYTSQIVEVAPAVDKGHAPHAVIAHDFRADHSEPLQDGPAAWEHGTRRALEEEMRNETLWFFDYMRKNRIQGVMQALSGGADSAYNAAKIRVMVELAVGELGVEGFLSSMSHLTYKDKVRTAYQAQGRAAAVDCVMEHMLTSVYMGTDNSSNETLNAARALVEGGQTAEGQTFKGIGGKFHYRNVQRLVDIYAEIFSGVTPSKIDDAREIEIRAELSNILRLRADDVTPEQLDKRIADVKNRFEEVTHIVLSVAKEEHQLAYENIQARLRQVLIMLFSNIENKIAVANPNLDEGRNSYATFGGDLHSGQVSGNAHKGKDRELKHMQLLHDHGLDGIAPISAFYWVLKNKPSAELQPLGKDGKVTQFDEDQLGRTFEQMDVISRYMLIERATASRKNNPIEVFEKCRRHPAFAGDSIEELHDRIRLSYDKWAHAQFKVHASPIAATYGENIDHQSSLRTPNIASFHKPELAALALHCLDLTAKRDGLAFENLSGGKTLAEAQSRAMLDAEVAGALTSSMWVREQNVGGRLRLHALYAAAKQTGLSAMMPESSRMADIFGKAKIFRQQANTI